MSRKRKGKLSRHEMMKLSKKYEAKIHGTGASFKMAHNGCVNKKRFHTRRSAKQRAKDLGYSYYQCAFCGGYHLTNPGKKKRKNAEEGDLDAEA